VDDMEGKSGNPGAKAVMFHENAKNDHTENSVWLREFVKDGLFRIKNKNSGYYLTTT